MRSVIQADPPSCATGARQDAFIRTAGAQALRLALQSGRERTLAQFAGFEAALGMS